MTGRIVSQKIVYWRNVEGNWPGGMKVERNGGLKEWRSCGMSELRNVYGMISECWDSFPEARVLQKRGLKVTWRNGDRVEWRS